MVYISISSWEDLGLGLLFTSIDVVESTRAAAYIPSEERTSRRFLDISELVQY